MSRYPGELIDFLSRNLPTPLLPIRFVLHDRRHEVLRSLSIGHLPGAATCHNSSSSSSRPRNFGTWQGRLPQELRLAVINTLEQAKAFLREGYLARLNERFAVAAREPGSASHKTSQSDLDWIPMVHFHQVVALDR